MDTARVKQHLIDPEICIRCNTCEATCPSQAISHDDRNYVVDMHRCNGCMACIAPCPTGAIDNWRRLPMAKAYTVTEQLGWDALPPECDLQDEPSSSSTFLSRPRQEEPVLRSAMIEVPGNSTQNGGYGSAIPPRSAAQAATNLYGPRAEERFVTATVAGNVRVTEIGKDYDTHHIVLDFGSKTFPVLEGQSIGILPPGVDVRGRPHHARQYSVASPRNGERPGYNNLSLTIKRVLSDYDGRPVRGVASNYMCDLKVGDEVSVVGPFGTTFLMPNHANSHIVMICTGTGSAPMRAMTEWRRRRLRSGEFDGGRLMLFFGARTREELPYFGPLTRLPRDFIDINLAFSRTPGAPKRYVQDLMREKAGDLVGLLRDPDAYFYVCGLKAMEHGVFHALRDIALEGGLDWELTAERMKGDGRLHFETY